jgi:hypothetical protein
MTQLTQLKKVDQPVSLVRAQTLDEVMSLGEVLAKSGFFSDARGAAQAVAKMLAGSELGFGPVASMTGIYIVKGRVSLSANLMAAAIKRSGKYNYRVKELTEKRCEIEFFENGERVGISAFTIDEAIAAKLDQDWDKDANKWKPKATWKNFPRNMLFARAMSNGAKWFCADIFGGPAYTPDELGAEIDGETGEIIDIIPEPPAARPQLAAVASQPTTEVQPEPPLETDPIKLAMRVQAPPTAEERAITAKINQVIDLCTVLNEEFGISHKEIKERIGKLVGVTERDKLDEEKAAKVSLSFTKWIEELKVKRSSAAERQRNT